MQQKKKKKDKMEWEKNKELVELIWSIIRKTSDC